MASILPTNPIRPTPLAPRPAIVRGDKPHVRNGFERIVDAMDRPRAPVRGHMSSADFINTLANYNTTIAGIAASEAQPNTSEARDLSMTKKAGSTLNAVLFGAPNRAIRAIEAPEGSHEVLHNALSGGVRLFAAACCATTVIIPVVAGIVGFARGSASSTRNGVVRQYKRHMMQDQVFEPLNRTLATSPSQVTAGDRAAVQAFLTTCKKNKKVAHIVQHEDLKNVKTWLADHPLK